MALRAVSRSVAARLTALALAVLLVAAAIAVLRYQPLHVGDLDPGSDMQATTIEEFEETGAHILRYSDDDYVTYSFTIRNTGPLGVTVTDVGLPDQAERRLLQPVAAGLARGGRVSAEDMLPVEPFGLAAGEEQQIVIQARFDNCEYYTERAIEILGSQTITFRVAGVPRTMHTQFDRPLLVRSPTIQGCADRTLDRSENRRTDP